MKKELREKAVGLIGDTAKAYNDDQLDEALLVFCDEFSAINTELSATNQTLTEQITTLSAAAPKPIELSAATKAVYAENVQLKINGMATDQNWSTAFRDEVAAELGGGTIALSVTAEGDEPLQMIPLSKALSLLAKRPVPGIATGGEQSGSQADTTLLSREASENGAAAAGVNPLLDTAKAMNPAK